MSFLVFKLRFEGHFFCSRRGQWNCVLQTSILHGLGLPPMEISRLSELSLDCHTWWRSGFIVFGVILGRKMGDDVKTK